MIYVNDQLEKQKYKLQKKGDPLKDYVRNFSEIHDVLDTKKTEDSSAMMGFANVLKQ